MRARSKRSDVLSRYFLKVPTRGYRAVNESVLFVEKYSISQETGGSRKIVNTEASDLVMMVGGHVSLNGCVARCGVRLARLGSGEGWIDAQFCTLWVMVLGRPRNTYVDPWKCAFRKDTRRCSFTG